VISAATGRPAAATPKPSASGCPASWELIASGGLVVIVLTADKDVWGGGCQRCFSIPWQQYPLTDQANEQRAPRHGAPDPF
jgi:hypothetical protein